MYIRGLRVCKQTRYCSISRTSLSVLKSLSPLAFLKIGGADARSVQKTPAGVLFVRRGLFFVKRRRRCLAHECTSVYIRGLRVCKQTRYCSISRTSLSVLKSLSPLAFLKIACPEVYIRVHFFPTYFRVCREKTSFIQNSLLINIPPVLGRSDDGFLRRKNITAD